jgi:hypothetical protein
MYQRNSSGRLMAMKTLECLKRNQHLVKSIH